MTSRPPIYSISTNSPHAIIIFLNELNNFAFLYSEFLKMLDLFSSRLVKLSLLNGKKIQSDPTIIFFL